MIPALNSFIHSNSITMIIQTRYLKFLYIVNYKHIHTVVYIMTPN